MLACSRCSQIFDEKKRQTCPNCFAPVAAPNAPVSQNTSGPGSYGASGYVPPPGAPGGATLPPMPNPNVRVSLTGEVFEAPSPPPAAPVYPPPVIYPPAAPQNYSAPLAPSVPKAEQNWIIAIGVAVFAVILLAVGFGVVKARQYSVGDAAFERRLHLDLSTPQSAAKEALNCVKEQAWARFYFVTAFQRPNITALAQSEAFAQSVRSGLAANPAGASLFTAKYSGMTDISAGTPQISGQTADVPVSAMLHFSGKDIPLNGVAHLINDDQGKWRLNLTAVSPACNTPQDQAAISKVLTDLLGLQTAPSVPANSAAGAAPATIPVQPMFTYPPGFGPDSNNPIYRQRFRGRNPGYPYIRRRGEPYPNPNYPYPPNMPQPTTPTPQPQNPQPAKNPQPGTPAPSSPNPTPTTPAPTNPSRPAPSDPDPKPSAPNPSNPNPSNPPAAPNGGNGSSQ